MTNAAAVSHILMTAGLRKATPALLRNGQSGFIAANGAQPGLVRVHWFPPGDQPAGLRRVASVLRRAGLEVRDGDSVRGRCLVVHRP